MEGDEFGTLLQRLGEEHWRVLSERQSLQQEVESLRTQLAGKGESPGYVDALPSRQHTSSSVSQSGSLALSVGAHFSGAKSMVTGGKSVATRVRGVPSLRQPPFLSSAGRPRVQRQDAVCSSKSSLEAEQHMSSIASSSEFEFKLQACWRDEATPRRSVGIGTSPPRRSPTLPGEVFEWAQGDQHLEEWTNGNHPRTTKEQITGCWKFIIADPSSPTRLAWDLIGALLILCDVVRIPLIVFSESFQVGDTQEGVDAFELFVLIFWTINMFMSLTVGHIHNGNTIMSPRKIFMKYLRTWFVPDALVLFPDWVFAIAFWTTDGGSDMGGNKALGLIRILRLMRLVRLLRVLRLMRVAREVNDRISSQHASILSDVVKMVIVLLVINHWIASTWFLIGTQAAHPVSWVSEFKLDRSEWEYQYFTALHWSLTQFTPASMDVQPTNVSERAFTIAVVVVAVITYSYILGSMTGSLAQLRELQSAYHKNFWDLRRYLAHNKVDPELCSRVQNYLDHAWHSRHQQLSIDRVKVLEMLSEELYNELKFQLVVPHLQIHPFLKTLCDSSKVTVQRLARLAIHHMHYAHGDTIFFPGEQASHMYILISGSLTYMDYLFRQSRVEPQAHWVSEMALWLETWLHLGSLQTTVESELLLVDPGAFQKSAVRNPRACWHCGLYAKELVSVMRRKNREHLSDIMSASSQEMQIVMSKLWADVDRGGEEETEASARLIESIVGQWIDQGREWYGGSVIEFSQDGWRPIQSNAHRNKYDWIPHHDKVELIELRANGAVRKFDLQRGGDEETLTVSINFEGNVKQWQLVRHGEGPARLQAAPPRARFAIPASVQEALPPLFSSARTDSRSKRSHAASSFSSSPPAGGGSAAQELAEMRPTQEPIIAV